MTAAKNIRSKPGQFFEISIPKYGEAPISVSGITDHSLDFTIRKVGSLTDEIFENYVGGHFFMRGPYGNGFDVNMFKGKEIVLVTGGSGLSPVHGVIDYFADHMDECKSLTVISGFKSPADILFKADLKRWIDDGMNFICTVDKARKKGITTAMSAWSPSISRNCPSRTSTTPSPSSSVRR